MKSLLEPKTHFLFECANCVTGLLKWGNAVGSGAQSYYPAPQTHGLETPINPPLHPTPGPLEPIKLCSFSGKQHKLSRRVSLMSWMARVHSPALPPFTSDMANDSVSFIHQMGCSDVDKWAACTVPCVWYHLIHTGFSQMTCYMYTKLRVHFITI